MALDLTIQACYGNCKNTEPAIVRGLPSTYLCSSTAMTLATSDPSADSTYSTLAV